MVEQANDVVIQVRSLFKVFGSDPDSVLPHVRDGASKDDILAATGHTVGLNDINLDIRKGEIFVIMGLSGSGKSTLIRHFNRLIEPTAGHIEVEGTNVLSLKTKDLEQFRRHKMSMVFQHFGLMPHRTVIENVAYGLMVQGVDKAARMEKATEWLDAVGLKGYEMQYPSQLSGGQKQRVGLARALCTDADILLMDEAFSALDPLIRSEMQDQLIELQQRLRKTIIFITHDLDEALRIGDTIAILKDGKLSQVGRPVDILLHPADAYVESFVRDVNRARVLTADVVMQPPACRLTTENLEEALQQMRGEGKDYGYVFDGANGYKGIVTRDSITKEIEDPSTNTELSDLAQKAPSAQPDTSLEDILPSSLEQPYPVAVVRDDGDFLGVVSRKTIISVLAGNDRETENAAAQ
jgi:glycine betaine/proline transport system ATP-binding protein